VPDLFLCLGEGRRDRMDALREAVAPLLAHR
jgi:hypothetical protein